MPLHPIRPMKIKLTRNWRDRKAGDTLEGRDAAAALNEKAAVTEGRKPVDRAEKRPSSSAERR